MKRLVVVDADGLAFKYYYALEGRVDYPMAFGVLRGVVKLYRDLGEPDRMVFVFDSEPDELKEIYPRYREGREEPWQLGRADYNAMIELLVGFGFDVYKKEGVEADRIIASIVNRNRGRYRIEIYSDDKDFFQLLDDDVVLIGERRGEWTGRDVEREFGLPDNKLFMDYLVLVGDAVDRVPRILRRREAIEVIRKKGALKGWFFEKDFDGLNEGLIEKLKERYKDIEINYKLVNLLDERRPFAKLESDKTEEEIEKLAGKVGLSDADISRIKSLGERI